MTNTAALTVKSRKNLMYYINSAVWLDFCRSGMAQYFRYDSLKSYWLYVTQ